MHEAQRQEGCYNWGESHALAQKKIALTGRPWLHEVPEYGKAPDPEGTVTCQGGTAPSWKIEARLCEVTRRRGFRRWNF